MLVHLPPSPVDSNRSQMYSILQPCPLPCYIFRFLLKGCKCSGEVRWWVVTCLPFWFRVILHWALVLLQDVYL